MLFVNLLRFIHGNSWLGPSRAASRPTCLQPAGSVQRCSQLSRHSLGWPGTQPLRECWPGQAGDKVQPQGPEPLTDIWAVVGGVWRVGLRWAGVGELLPLSPASFHSRS